MIKYLKLYEEYNKQHDYDSGNSKSWADIRDRFQSRLPYIIIDFENVEARSICIENELFDEVYVKQRYYSSVGTALSSNAEELKLYKYPSVFIFEESNKLINRVNSFLKRFDIKRILVGEMGAASSILYVDGESMEYGGEIITSRTPNDIGGDDYYKFESTYYKIIK